MINKDQLKIPGVQAGHIHLQKTQMQVTRGGRATRFRNYRTGLESTSVQLTSTKLCHRIERQTMNGFTFSQMCKILKQIRQLDIIKNWEIRVHRLFKEHFCLKYTDKFMLMGNNQLSRRLWKQNCIHRFTYVGLKSRSFKPNWPYYFQCPKEQYVKENPTILNNHSCYDTTKSSPPSIRCFYQSPPVYPVVKLQVQESIKTKYLKKLQPTKV